MTEETDDASVERLECGRDPLDVVDRARAGAGDEHELTCPFCQNAITADEATRRTAVALQVDERDVAVPDTLLPNVMRSVWAELRPTEMIPLATTVGTGFVSAAAAATAIEAALERMPDLQVHSCAVSFDPDEPGTEATGGPAVRIEISAAAAYGADLLSVADRARAVVAGTVVSQFGWSSRYIDIDIVDVWLQDGDDG